MMRERIRAMFYSPDTQRQFITGFRSTEAEAEQLFQEFKHEGTGWLENPSAPATRTRGGKVHANIPIGCR